jgi:DNA-binding winged helix-turn-helix (wHTH) protein
MSGSFRFAEFQLDTAAYALSRGGKRIKLEKLPMELLILLVGSAGTLVDRRAIQTALWSAGVFVEHDPATNTAVRKIRLALEDDAEKPRFVETVVGKGYRFIAAVERNTERSPFAACCLTRGRQEFTLGGGDNVLGRDPKAHVYIEHPSVSRRHAQISIWPHRAVLVDLESRNGTFLSGQRIDSPTEVRHGAIIGLGPITVTFRILSGPASTKPVRR